MKRACVIGWPISHSRSPLIHTYWLKQLGIAGEYERVPIEPRNLRSFVAALPERYRGCNVTIPHKETAAELVEFLDDTARRLGAVNTIFVEDGRLHGTSTDGEGFLNSLGADIPSLRLADRRAVVLGAGGSAMAVIGALLDSGMREVAVANRTLERAQRLAAKFGAAVKPSDWERRHSLLSDCALLVNTTALGMTGQPPLDIDLARLPRAAAVADIVYTPLRTSLLAAAAERGNPVMGGLGMLLHQAVRGFELWFGARPAVTEDLRDIVARDIDPAARI